MDSFAKPARLLYCHVHRSIKPFSGVTPPHVPGFRLDSTNLILTSIKGAMRYPDFLTSTQLPLLCFVLGQLRSTELAAGMLDLSAGRIKSRSVGLELALVEWIVDIMELTESTDDRRWVRTIFEHLISLVITFMLSSTIRFNEIVVKLNSRLEGRIWTRSSRHIMWFVLNATSGFIGKNMLTDFVPCLRLFDILFPEAEDPDRAIELQTGVCGKFCAQRSTDQDAHSGSAFGCAGDIEQTDMTDDSMQVPKVECPELLSSAAALPLVHDEDSNTVLESKDDETEEEVCLTTTSAEDSEDESSLSIVPPNCHHSTICRRRQSRFMYLTTASVCLWQHVLRKSRTGYDHLPRVMPPALRPMEARIAYRMRSLTDAVRTLNSPEHTSSIASQLTWRQFVVVLNAYSTDNEAGQLIQQLVDLFWLGTPEDDTPDASPEYGRLWHKLMHNGTVPLPYGLVAQGRLQPLSNHLIRTMSVHLRMLVLHLFLQKISSLPFSEQLTTPGVMETLCRLLACREVEPSNVSRILNLLPKLQPMHPPNGWDVPEHSPSATLEQCSPPASYLLSTLLDTLGHRLADTLLPELQVQTLVAMVNLLRLWTAWSTLHPPSDSDETRTGSDGRTCSTDIPLDLMHTLEWTVIKLIRNLQSPDCVLYGLCSSISPACLAQAQAQASSASSSSNSAAYVPPNSAPSSGASSNPPRARPSQPSAPDGSASTSTSCDAPSTNAVVLPAPFPAYPFLMTECLELNRFILFSLLQIYYAYDLDEISAMKAFLVEQIRTMCERCGPHSLTELPRFILNRLPEFLMHIMRQRSSPCFTGSSISISAETSERRQSLVTLPLMVLDEFNRLTDNGTTWTMIAGRSNLLLCVALRYSAVHGSVPKSIMNVITRMPNAQLNAALRALCDYTVACECGMQSCDELMLQNCVSALSSLCVTYRVVPLDRFILFLMTHTNYQGAQLNAVNQILVHLLTRSGPLLGAIQYLNARFPIPMDCSSSPTTGRPSLHPNPVSSRTWPECVLHLHSILPDQYFVDNTSRSMGMSASPSPSQPLPIIYGHLLLRLLPLLESVLSQFLDSNLPLLQLIPFCREISPLFRFHRRPVSVCYVLLREHWHFTPLDPDAFILHDGMHPSPLSGDRRFNWFVDRLRVQILVHCVLKHHHALASAVSCRHAGKQNETDSSAAGLFTHKGWSQLQFTADTCDRLHQDISTLVSSNTITAHDAEIQLKSQLFDWFIARPNGPDVAWVDSLLVPIRRSTVSHGIHGHPSAWRPWNFEENVSIQAAGLYAGAVEVMCSFCSPSDFVSALTEFFSHRHEFMEALPFEVLECIFNFLPLSDQKSASLTCRKFYAVATQPKFLSRRRFVLREPIDQIQFLFTSHGVLESHCCCFAPGCYLCDVSNTHGDAPAKSVNTPHWAQFISRLSLVDTQITAPDLFRLLGHCTQLQSLDLSGCSSIFHDGAQDFVVSPTRNVSTLRGSVGRSLRHLSLAHVTSVTDVYFQQLMSLFPRIEDIDLSGCPINFSHLPLLTSSSSCTYLSFGTLLNELIVLFRDQAFVSNRAITLRLNSTELDDSALGELAAADSVRFRGIYIDNCHKVTDDGVFNFTHYQASFGCLQEFSFSFPGPDITSKSLIRILKCFSPTLTYLCLSRWPTSDYLSSAFSCCHNLEHLDLSSCYVYSQFRLNGLWRHFHCLTSLNLSARPDLTDADILALCTQLSNRIKFLDVSFCTSLTDLALEAICSGFSESLQVLIANWCKGFSDNGMLGRLNTTEAQFTGISSLHRLEQLNLCDCPQITGCCFWDAHRLFDRSSHNLTSLRLGRVSALENRAVLSLIDAAPSLRVLDISRAEIDDDTLDRVAFKLSMHLRQLHLAGCEQLTDVSLRSLAFRIPSLQLLDVSFCPRISRNALSEFHKCMPRLRELNALYTGAMSLTTVR
ncbi:unnamed protein product [Dicrocoelium dendriticum]|nr:unnamed protein product [Dicrocoelium dendriticum]